MIIEFKQWVYYDPIEDQIIIGPAPENLGCAVLRADGKYQAIIYIGEL